ncbi:MAG: HEPN domain-containing protein [Proteobacteria bacterium]|nr:HEPN domain-containing protein [Pseudomonadota bacterium]
MQKAERALTSARVLLDLGDVDGACNRAYYAMFDAARAALIATNAPTAPEIAKTHSGLITAFSLHLVKSGQVPVEFGKAFNRVADIRLVADYTGDEVDSETARWSVDQSGRFVAEIIRFIQQASGT